MITYRFPSIILRCYCGIEPRECKYPQNLEIDLTFEIQKEVENIHCLEDTLNYADFIKSFINVFEMQHFPLVEDVAREIKIFCKDFYPATKSLNIIITKNISFPSCQKIIFGEKFTL